MLVRHGIMLVGPSGGGKTVARNILNRALSILPVYTFEKNSEKQKKEIPISLVFMQLVVFKFILNNILFYRVMFF